MKKILLGIMIILLGIIAYVTVANGYTIGGLEVLGITEIKNKNEQLDAKIDQVEKLKSVTYLDKMSELNEASKTLIKEKKSYEELVSYSRESDVEKANQQQVYEIEVLWTKIGMHATQNGVKLKFDVVESSTNTPNLNDLKFTATGNYISLTDFISDLEKDANLSFTIEEFNLIPSSSADTTAAGRNLQATFRVKDIALNLNTTTISR